MTSTNDAKPKRKRSVSSANHTKLQAYQVATSEARVERIAVMMRSLTFQRGVTGKLLAKEWKLSEQRVGELCARASRKVRAELTDPERVTVDVCVSLETVIRRAMAVDDFRSVVQAAKTWAMLTGNVAPQRIQVTDVALEKLPEAEREALVREAVAALSGKPST